ncbi:uncharacterized protein LOC136714747 isoform X2 [Amia ocellicauda]|uniref:uncharacterized protein LOC136714747 isoform X2 n=1 Tax=Amia ocellicauda TaxID=2972642 RepID=UPI003463A9B2
MTTRLLASFNALDRSSQNILDKHARSRQLGNVSSRSFAACHETSNSPLTCACGWDFDLPSTRRTDISKPKTAKDIINEEQRLLHEKIRTTRSVRPLSVFKRGPRLEHSGQPTVRPFTSPEELAWRQAHWKGKQKSPEEGFMVITIKKSQSLKTGNCTARRLKWSREVERVPRLEALESSQAQVGAALAYTDTSHWSTFSANSHRAEETPVSAFTEDDGQYSMPGSAGRLVAQQLQEGNVVRVGMNGTFRSSEGNAEKDTLGEEHVRGLKDKAADITSAVIPLSFEDELEKTTARILTPKSQDVYSPLPIVSRTYPVVYHKDYQYKPFSSPSFHHLDPRDYVQQRTVRMTNDQNTFRSAIVRITQSMQEEHMAPKATRREMIEKHFALRPETNLKRKKSGNLNNRLFSANGKMNCRPEYRMVSQELPMHNVLSSMLPSNRAPLTLTIASRFKHASSAEVGPIRNGVNPTQPLEFEAFSTHFLKGVQVSMKRQLMHGGNQTPSLPNRSLYVSQENNMDFISISKPLKHSQNEIDQILGRRFSEEVLFPENLQSQSENTEDSYQINVLLSRPNSGLENRRKFQEECRPREASPVDVPSPIPVKIDEPEICPERPNTSGVLTRQATEVEHQTDPLPEEETKPPSKNPPLFDPHQVISIPTAETEPNAETD